MAVRKFYDFKNGPQDFDKTWQPVNSTISNMVV